MHRLCIHGIWVCICRSRCLQSRLLKKPKLQLWSGDPGRLYIARVDVAIEWSALLAVLGPSARGTTALWVMCSSSLLYLNSIPKPEVRFSHGSRGCWQRTEVSFMLSVAAAAAKSLQSCPTLCDPIDGSPPGSPVSGILQARTLEWVAISFCNAWKWKMKVKSLNRVRLLATPWTAAYQAPPSMGFSRQDLGS